MLLEVSGGILVVAVGDKLIIGTKECLRPKSESIQTSSESIVVISHEDVDIANSTEDPLLLDNLDELKKNSQETMKHSSMQPHNVGLDADRPDLEHGRWFSAVAVSSKGNFVAAADNLKRLFVYRVLDESGLLAVKPVLVSQQILAKRSMAIIFSADEKTIIVSDKLGDAYIFGTMEKTKSKPSSPILGHISVLTDVILSPDEKFILTSDRDEKIRVSHYPLAFDIQSFCLGHTKFVTKLLIPTSDYPIVLSGSGDSTVRAFNYITGDELGVVVCVDAGISQAPNLPQPHIVAMEFHRETQILFVALNQQKVISLYKIGFTLKDNGQIDKVTFTHFLQLPQSSPVLCLALMGDALLTIRKDSCRPLVFMDVNFLKKAESPVALKMDETILAAMNQIGQIPGGMDLLLNDPYSELSRQVDDDMADLSDGMKKAEVGAGSKKKKLRASEVHEREIGSI